MAGADVWSGAIVCMSIVTQIDNSDPYSDPRPSVQSEIRILSFDQLELSIQRTYWAAHRQWGCDGAVITEYKVIINHPV